MVLQGYWQADIAPEMKTAIMADWADELEDWPVAQIRWGLREWRRDNPRRKPNPGDILAVLKKRRGEEWARQAPTRAPDPQPIRADAETRAKQAEMVAQLFPSIRRIPEVKE